MDQSNINPNPVPPVAPPTIPTPTPTQPPVIPTGDPSSPTTPQKSKKTGLIIGIIIAAVVIIGAVAGFFIYKALALTPTQIVTKAVAKSLSPDAPKRLATSGTIKLELDEFVKTAEIKFDVKSDSKKLSSSGDLSATINIDDLGEVPIDLSLSALEGKSFFIKLSNLENSLTKLSAATPIFNEDFIEKIVELLDNKWIGFEASDALTELGQDDAETSNCVISKLQNFDNEIATIGRIFNENNFISATIPESAPIAKQQSTLYQVSFLPEKLATFTNAVMKSDVPDALLACNNSPKHATEEITADDFAEVLDSSSQLFVEVDKDFNFSRIYLATSYEDSAKITADFSLSPINEALEISAPEEYTPFADIFEKLSSAFTDETTYSED